MLTGWSGPSRRSCRPPAFPVMAVCPEVRRLDSNLRISFDTVAPRQHNRWRCESEPNQENPSTQRKFIDETDYEPFFWCVPASPLWSPVVLSDPAAHGAWLIRIASCPELLSSYMVL